jgi:putative transposase
MNRAARRLTLFETSSDYASFSGVLREATERFEMRLLCYVVMPNHWHLVVWPAADETLSASMAWMTADHVRRWHRRHNSIGSGTLYQGRYKALAVQDLAHFYTVCRYVERNPVRARLVTRPVEWPWSSACDRPSAISPRLVDWPVARPGNWSEIVEHEEPPTELGELRRAIARSRPFGAEPWAVSTAASLGWTTGMRSRGRPRGQ